MKIIICGSSISYIIVAYLFLFAISDVRGMHEGDPSGDVSGDGSGDGVDPEGSGTDDPCDGFVCANDTDVCKVKNLCIDEDCQDIPVCEPEDKPQDLINLFCHRRNEEYRFCGTKCEPTCDNPNPSCHRGCWWFRCQCRAGYVRHRNGECCRPWQCPKRCGWNEEFKRCGTSCEPTCWNPHPGFCKPCRWNVCQCKYGYVRNSHGNCVPKWWCHRG